MTWIIELDTGRFGDWRVVEADTREQAIKQLTRTQRRKVKRVREFIPTSVWLGRKAA